MRQIKFRAWDTEEKIMRKNWTDLNLPPNHGLELMQFTGLLDKNGKEIYEGDIIGDISLDGHAGVVIYFTERSRYVIEHPNKKRIYELFANCEYEIIGNIYENPELITKSE